MRTSEEIYHKVRWDPRFDPARFVLGVEQRGKDPKRIPLPSFTPGGEVPWHRVIFIEADGDLVWDRTTGLDSLDATGAGRARAPRTLAAPFFEPRTPHAWDPVAEAWLPMSPARFRPDADARTSPDGIRILTWNTLWDRYDPELIDTERRRPMLISALRDTDADVIILQEVERELLRMLQHTSWVRESLTLSCDPKSSDVDYCGVLVLSRLPVREAGWHKLGPHKALVALTVAGNNSPLTVIGVHLTSDHTDGAAARRAAELAELATGISGLTGDVVVAGDFNDATEGQGDPAHLLGLVDAGHELGPTFNPAANPLAAISSRSGRAGRLDRILLRSNRSSASDAALLGTQPDATGLFVSDHFGMVATFGNRSATDIAAECSAVDDVTRRIAAVFGTESVHVVGSRRLDCALPGADLDLVAELAGLLDLDAAHRRINAAFPDAEWTRQVGAVRTAGLKMGVRGLNVDLTLAADGDVDSAYALSAVSDADAIRAAVSERGGDYARFTRLARTIKLWARNRGLDSAPFGTLPAFAWTLLAARTAIAVPQVADDTALEDRALLLAFFEQWSEWDWCDKVTLDGVPADAAPSAITILTPSPPVRSMTAQVSAASRDLIVEELVRGWEITGTASPGADFVPDLCAAPNLDASHKSWLFVRVRRRRSESFDLTIGRMRGRMRALATDLEGAGATDARLWPRPVLTEPDAVAYAVGIGRTPPRAREIEAIAAAWAATLPGVTIERLQNAAEILGEYR